LEEISGGIERGEGGGVIRGRGRRRRHTKMKEGKKKGGGA
jgi:hypothetical protein